MKQLYTFFLLTLLNFASPSQINAEIDYSEFLSQHDMQWDTVPHLWTLAPYSGNGNVGFTFYKHAKDKEKNQISLNLGRHDYYDHRLPYEGRPNTWIYTCRLPLGRFQLESVGDVTGADLNLSLYNAELNGTITTTKGSYTIQGFSHSTIDTVYCSIKAENGESVKLKWIPAKPKSSVRDTLEKGGGPKGGSWSSMAKDPYPMPPYPVFGMEDGFSYCKQILHNHRGETTTAWTLKGEPESTQTLMASIHHSFPERNSLETTVSSLKKCVQLEKENNLTSTHQEWWHDYYKQSFLTLNDVEKEAFYWIQMYKLGSSMRGNGPIMDLMGPWYEPTFWPMVWGDLNVQLQYWTHLTSNRLSLGESLPNNIDKYASNLAKNIPKSWQGKGDLVHLGTCFPQDMIAKNGHTAPDMLCWILHNYWLHCQYAADDERLRDQFYPLLKKTMNSYLFWIGEERLKGDGPITLPASWSPEYPGPWDENCNFTIGLLKWCVQTLLQLNKEHNLGDEKVPVWENFLSRLPQFQIDENGIRIAKNTAFDKPHRHYSHLLSFYPLALITPEENGVMLRTSVDHWLEVTRQKGASKLVQAMPVTGYTATGAASMYAWLGDADNAYYYLDFLIQHKNVSPTTMYAEGNPVIESPLSFCTSLHDMILQSYGSDNNVINVLPACPKNWPDLAFHDFRAQGAFLVSAKRNEGETQFVTVKSLAGKPCRIKTDLNSPSVYLNGNLMDVKPDAKGVFTIDLQKGAVVEFYARPLAEMTTEDLTISPLKVAPEQRHLFGFSKKTERLPSHNFYKNKDAK